MGFHHNGESTNPICTRSNGMHGPGVNALACCVLRFVERTAGDQPSTDAGFTKAICPLLPTQMDPPRRHPGLVGNRTRRGYV